MIGQRCRLMSPTASSTILVIETLRPPLSEKIWKPTLRHIAGLGRTRIALRFADQLSGLIPKNWTVEKCSSAQVKGAEGNEEKSVQRRGNNRGAERGGGDDGEGDVCQG